MASTINSEALESGREDFMRGYVEAMLWANTFVWRPGEEESTCEDVAYWYQSPGRWWEDTPVDLTDAEAFWDVFGYVLLSLDYSRGRGEQWPSAEMAGHDFALTRNGHGAGFWDRGLGEMGDMLSKECKPYGSHTVIINVDNDDNIISAHNEN